MRSHDPGPGERQARDDSVAATSARARRPRKSARAHLHPVEDPDAWRNAVLAEPEPEAPPTEDGQ